MPEKSDDRGSVTQAQSRRVGIDLAIAAALTFGSFIACATTDAFETFQEVSRDYEYLELDEALIALLSLGLGAIFFALRRLQDQRREMVSRIDAEARSARLAMHDDLTGLPNRRLFRDRLRTAIERVSRYDEMIAVMVLDIDRFKPVNDLHGHGAGDRLLVTISERFTRVLRKHDTLARVGGDEFTICQVALGSRSDAVSVAERLVKALEGPIEIDGKSLIVGVSIGVCLGNAEIRDPNELIRRASVALRKAKKRSGSGYYFYDQQLDVSLALRATLERELRGAIEAAEIVPHYQPIIDLASGKIICFEALARWHSATRGFVSPEDFIAVAEDSNQIMELSELMLRQACRDAKSWPEDILLSINISPLQFRDNRLDEEILAILDSEGFPPERLEVEVTENALVEDPDLADRILMSLKARGVRTSLDDFGTGHSSLVRLRDLAFDKIKIDRSFVSDLTGNSQNAAIVEAVLAMGNSLGLPTAAEGIEDDTHLETLREKGCVLGQGYHFSRPVPAADVGRLITEIPEKLRKAARDKAAGDETGGTKAEQSPPGAKPDKPQAA